MDGRDRRLVKILKKPSSALVLPAVWALALLISLAVSSNYRADSRLITILGFSLNSLLFFYLTRLRTVAGWMQSINAWQKSVLAGMLFLALIGHYAGLSDWTFPFMRWSMYAQSKPSSVVEAVILIGKLSDGGSVILNKAEVFRPFAAGRIQQKMSSLHRQAGSDEFSRSLYDQTLKEAAKLYSSHYADAAVTAVEVYTVRMDAHDALSGPIQLPKNQKPDRVISVW